MPGFLGGGVKSPTTITTTETSAATGYGVTQSGQVLTGINLGGGSSLTLSDAGAVSKAFGLADRAFASIERQTAEAGGRQSQLEQQAFTAVQNARAQSGDIDAGQLIRWAIVAAVIVGGVYLVKG